MVDADRRAALRSALVRRYPWIDDPDLGPRTVEAGECDRCGTEARLVATCGPVRWAELGRRCAAEVGTDGWCDGHADEAVALLARLAALEPDADTVARVWWVATGEVRIDDTAARGMIAGVLPAVSDEQP